MLWGGGGGGGGRPGGGSSFVVHCESFIRCKGKSTASAVRALQVCHRSTIRTLKQSFCVNMCK